jgi:hypothetical protein
MSLIERRRFLSGATAFQALAAASTLLAVGLPVGARASLVIARVLDLRAIGSPPYGQQLGAHQSPGGTYPALVAVGASLTNADLFHYLRVGGENVSLIRLSDGLTAFG